MSTRSISGIADLRELVTTTADGVRKRAEEVVAAAGEREQQKERDNENAEIARRLLEQEHDDELAVLNEEAGQLARILGHAPHEPDTTVATEPVQPAPAEEPPTAPVEPTVVTTPVQTENTTSNQSSPSRDLVTVVRNFTWLQWVLAIFGAFVGLLIGVNTTVDGNASGFWAASLNFFWCIGLIILGFGLGGLVGALIQRRGDTT